MPFAEYLMPLAASSEEGAPPYPGSRPIPVVSTCLSSGPPWPSSNLTKATLDRCTQPRELVHRQPRHETTLDPRDGRLIEPCQGFEVPLRDAQGSPNPADVGAERLEVGLDSGIDARDRTHQPRKAHGDARVRINSFAWHSSDISRHFLMPPRAFHMPPRASVNRADHGSPGGRGSVIKGLGAHRSADAAKGIGHSAKGIKKGEGLSAAWVQAPLTTGAISATRRAGRSCRRS